MKTPITYYGGQQTLAKRSVEMIPPHKIYCELFFGGGAVFFQKEPSQVEIINDLNSSLMTFWEESQNNFQALSEKVKKTLHARIYHEQARAIYREPQKHSNLDVAWAVWVLATMSYGSKLNGSFGFDRDGLTSARNAAKRKAFTEAISTRLEKVTIEKRNALELIRIFDSEETFFYLDPPYFNSRCGHYSGYSESDFEALLEALSDVQGKFLLSSFPSEVLSRFREKNNWKTKTIERTISVCHSARPKRIEVLTSNF